MFGIGGGELLILLILVFLFYGPERLPEKARKAGKVIRYLRGFTEEIRESIEREIDRPDPQPEKKAPPEDDETLPDESAR